MNLIDITRLKEVELLAKSGVESTIVEADVSSVQAAAWQTQCRTLCHMLGSWLTLGGQLAVTK